MTFNIFLKNPIGCHSFGEKKVKVEKVEGILNRASLVAQTVKNLTATWEILGYFICRKVKVEE